MTNPSPNTQSLRCYVTVDFDCGYLPNRKSRNLVVDPNIQLTTEILGNLLDLGFRRSGDHVYRPHCDQCKACLPLRVPVAQFKSSRSQKRCWNQNNDIQHQLHAAEFNPEHFELYKRYLEQRHPDSSMSDPTEEDYLSFLTCNGVNTFFHEFRIDGRLVAIAVTDHVPLGLSAVYTFFEPELTSRGLGTYAILWQIKEAQRQQLPYIYLGYWIEECDAMRYKSNFKPVEFFKNGVWQPLSFAP